jgi:uncharacterized protein (TIGR02996 family)
MTDEDALLAAVVAAPDDDTPRLAYADWLDEHGQPDRAEFIRVQVARARLAPGDERDEELRRREATLFGRHRKNWLRPFRTPLPGARCAFTRGFVEAIDTEVSLYLRAEADLYRTTILRDVVVRRVQDWSGLCFRSRPFHVRLRAVTRDESRGQSRIELDILRQAPPRLEPHLTRGPWVVFAWAVWSGPDWTALARVGTMMRRRRWPIPIGIRPFDDPAEFIHWCGDLGTFGSPLWIRLNDGRLAWYVTGLDPPDDSSDFWYTG